MTAATKGHASISKETELIGATVAVLREIRAICLNVKIINAGGETKNDEISGVQT